MPNPLRPQVNFDDLVCQILARFSSGSGPEIDAHVRTSLQEIAQFIEVDYAFLIEIRSDHSTWSATHEWCAPGIPSQLANYQRVPMGTFDWGEQMILAGEALVVNNLQELPCEAAKYGEQLRSLGFQSTLQVPLRGRGGAVKGCIALSSVQKAIAFKPADVQRLRLVGEAVANALERKRVEQSLRESETRFRVTFEQAPVGIISVGLDGRLLEANPHFSKMLGHTRDELLGWHFRDFTHPDDCQASVSLYQEVLARRVSVQSVEKRYLHKDGTVVWGNLTLSLVCDDTGRPQTFIAAIENITARKLAETQLRAALEEVERLTERLRAENIYLQEEITSSQGFDEIVGQSELLRSTLSQIEHVAKTDASVLLLGETGTGKELLARAIHQRSSRKDHPMVKVNLAALPSSLIESELFGHVKGAFTGAVSDKVGRFELADGGTLFLDEIGELDPELQTKLLRVLQEGEFERIGCTTTTRVDVRLVAATNRDLHWAMEQGKFRPDLYYRLAVFPIEVPPLRLRRDDIPLLVWHFIAKKQVRLGKTIRQIPREAMNALAHYNWPGNVRELENVIERAMILSPGTSLVLEESFQPVPRPHRPAAPTMPHDLGREHVLQVLEDCHWKVKGPGNAADRLGMKPSTLRYRMKRLGLSRPF